MSEEEEDSENEEEFNLITHLMKGLKQAATHPDLLLKYVAFLSAAYFGWQAASKFRRDLPSLLAGAGTGVLGLYLASQSKSEAGAFIGATMLTGVGLVGVFGGGSSTPLPRDVSPVPQPGECPPGTTPLFDFITQQYRCAKL